MKNKVFTIGYAGFIIKDFIKTLRHYGVNLLIDIRSLPYSAHSPEYNKKNLEYDLKKSGINYKSYSKEFGARQTERRYFAEGGYLDFELFSNSYEFLKGVEEIKDDMRQGAVIAFMCAEKDPRECHRSIMVSKFFYNEGYDIYHLIQDGKFITQKDVEINLLDEYFPERHQISMFAINESDDVLIAKAYKKKNIEIGYRMEDKDDSLYDRLY